MIGPREEKRALRMKSVAGLALEFLLNLSGMPRAFPPEILIAFFIKYYF
jgi:hypothetical protein